MSELWPESVLDPAILVPVNPILYTERVYIYRYIDLLYEYFCASRYHNHINHNTGIVLYLN